MGFAPLGLLTFDYSFKSKQKSRPPVVALEGPVWRHPLAGFFAWGSCPTKKLGVLASPPAGSIPAGGCRRTARANRGEFCSPALRASDIYKQWFSPSVAAGAKVADSEKARRGEAGMPSLTAGQGCPVWQPGSSCRSAGNLPPGRQDSWVPFFCFVFLGKQKDEGAWRGETLRF